MKVVHISHMDIVGGASRAGYGIFKSLDASGIALKMIVQEKFGDSRNIFSVSDSWLEKQLTISRTFLDLLPMYLYTHKEKGRFSFGKTGIDISRRKIISEADILHFHWINGGFLSIKNINELICLRKPLFWTFHDMWVFTGGCHYSGSCERYTANCGNCPYLKKPSDDDASDRILSEKKKIFRNADLHIITPSNWLKDCVQRSSLFHKMNIEVIPYAVDINLFQPKDKKQAKTELGLPQDKILILFGSMNLKDERKGFRYFKDSLLKLSSHRPELSSKISIVVFGRVDQSIQKEIPFNFIFPGRINSDKKMVTLYSAADFFVTSSIEDNYPNTVMESLSCGIPVLAFNIGGIPDMVSHLNNGYLADPFSIDSLAAGIEWMIDNKEIRDILSRNSREGIIKNNSPSVIGDKYVQLYNQSLQKN